MIKSTLYCFLAFLLLYMAGCCGKKSISRRYYTIDVSEHLNKINSPNEFLSQQSCEIYRVDIVDAYSTQRIANRSQSHEITYYAFNEWAHDPRYIIARILKQYVEHQRLFSEVSTRFTKEPPDYRIETRIDHMEVVESKNLFEAHLELEFRLLDLKAGSLMVSHHTIQKQPLSEKDLNLFAAAISDMLYKEIQVFSKKIIETLQANS